MIAPETLKELLGRNFTDEQLAAICGGDACADLAPSVIVASAGTGKTTVMAARVVWLVLTGAVKPHQVLGLTFTRKAAGELADRIAAALVRAGVVGDAAEGPEQTVSTYDAFAGAIVSEFGLHLGIDRGARLLGEAERFQVASEVVCAEPGPLTALSRLGVASIVERVLKLDAALQSHLVSCSEAAALTQAVSSDFAAIPPSRGKNPPAEALKVVAASEERLELLHLVEGFQRAKAQLGAIDFADQLAQAVHLAESVPAVAATFRDRYRVVLLDEYQDTSAAQVRLLRGLFAPGFPVTAVGDPRQAIYEWRGASATNIDGFPRQFLDRQGAEAAQFSLRINHRSGSQILTAGNAVVRPLAAEGTDVLLSPPGAPSGHVGVHHFNTDLDELTWVADRIEQHLSDGDEAADIAVLTRTNKRAAELFALLSDRGIPAELLGLGGLVELPEIAPIVATLRLLDDPTRNPDLITLLTCPRFAVAPSDLQALGRRARELAGDQSETESTGDWFADLQRARPSAYLLEAARNLGQRRFTALGRRRITEAVQVLSRLRFQSSDSLVDLMRRAMGELGLDVEMRLREASEQLERLLDVAAGFTSVRGESSLGAFLAWLEVECDAGDGLERASLSGADSVKLLTVHRAKGLEWDTVFLPSLNEGTFPAKPRDGIWPQRAEALLAPLRGDADGVAQLAEHTLSGLKDYKALVRQESIDAETRLAYVAVTRAKRTLYASSFRWAAGRKTKAAPSVFLERIEQNADVVESAELTEENPDLLTAAGAPWPHPSDASAQERLHLAAKLVEEAGTVITEQDAWVFQSGVTDQATLETLRDWDRDLAAISQRVAQRHRRVVLPEGLSASALMKMQQNPDGFARNLVRPMPQAPSAQASIGSRFHSWVQRRFTLPGTLDELSTPVSEEDLDRLIDAFERGQFADRQPLAVEVPFIFSQGSHVIRGQIDAVYAWSDAFDEMVVDWKTSSGGADPLQLAVYRQAWAGARGLPLERVGAAFYYVPTDRLEVSVAEPGELDRTMEILTTWQDQG